MKPAHLIFLIPFLVYLSAAIILQPGALVPLYPDADLTPYLSAISIGKDYDLAYTREDSDRYLRQYDQRPSPFRVINKKTIDGTGGYKQHYTFYDPEVFVFFLVPFLSLFGFRGWLLLHTLLIVGIYWIGWMYYRGKDEDAVSPALNSVIYFSLIPVPVLFLVPSHALFLIAVCTAAIFSGLRGYPILSAAFLALAFSSQPFAAIFCVFFIAYWQATNSIANIGKFLIAIILLFFAVWGLESLMYPPGNVSEPRWVTSGAHAPLAEIWNSLPDARVYYWSAPDLQRLIDFLFGRNSGFLIYGFAAASLLLSVLWLWRDTLVRVVWLFVVLYLALITFTHTSSWNSQSFFNDLWILLCPLPFFAAPFIRPKRLFVAIAIPAALLLGPLLVNPLGAILNRSNYDFAFPYRYLPVEISTVGRAGITKDPVFQQYFEGAKIYFLNDNFYKEGPRFWLRGESRLEFLLQVKNPEKVMLELQNGVLENRITLRIGKSDRQLKMASVEKTEIDLSPDFSHAKSYEGFYYLHGELKSDSGYVPGLLSRDNPDYRFLGCQVMFHRGSSAAAGIRNP